MNIIESVQSCEKCNLRENIPFGCTPIFGTGYSDADIVIVLDGPVEQDILYDSPLMGAASDFLILNLENAGINKKQVFVTNLVKCPGKVLKKNILACINHLHNQIRIIQPRVIITLGTKVNKIDDFCINNIKVFRGKSPKYVLERGKKIREEFANVFIEVGKWLNHSI